MSIKILNIYKYLYFLFTFKQKMYNIDKNRIFYDNN